MNDKFLPGLSYEFEQPIRDKNNFFKYRLGSIDGGRTNLLLGRCNNDVGISCKYQINLNESNIKRAVPQTPANYISKFLQTAKHQFEVETGTHGFSRFYLHNDYDYFVFMRMFQKALGVHLLDPNWLPSTELFDEADLGIPRWASEDEIRISKLPDGIVLDTDIEEFIPSQNAKLIGDIAEKRVLQYLKSELPAAEKGSLRWVANEGEKPGWDIEYLSNGVLHAVEVKGTVLYHLQSRVNITSNEWNAAIRLQEQYSLFLVARCLSPEAIIEVVRNPAKNVEEAQIHIEPSAYFLSF